MSDIPPLIFSHSHHLLTVRGCASLLDVLSFEGYEALSEPFRYVIEFTSADRAITASRMLMQKATFTLQAPVDQGFGVKIQRPVRTIQGVVTAFERLSTSKDETRYSLTLQPRLALLSRSRQNRIYRDMSVPQIVEHILRTRHNMRGEDFVFTLANEYPRREQVMQYGEDDLHFISRLLGEVGIWFRFTADTRLHIDEVAFYDDQRHYEQGLVLPAVSPSGQHDGGAESVWGMASRHNVVPRSVFTRDYNYRNAPEDMSLSAGATSGDSTTYGEAYHWGDNYLTPGGVGRHNPQPESGAFYARLRHERYLNNQTRLSGKSSSAALAPGLQLQVTGGEEVTDIFRRGVVMTKIHCSARRDHSYEVAFEAIPCSKRYGFRPEPGDKPVMAGTLPARVTSTKTNDIYGHIDREGRYKVNLLFDRDRWEAGEESLWVRQARPYAGDTYGLHLPLLAGTEVAIAFEQGDPDRPYIAGVLHDSAHPDHVTIQNYKRNVLRTPANNKIRLDDTRGKEHIKVSTEYGGKSQLNLGHLVDVQRQPRGEGFELRSDAWGAIRAGKGIFITADDQPKAQAQQLEMKAALETLQQAQGLAQSLSEAVKTAKAELAQVKAQKSLMETSLNALQQAALLLSAPAGIAQVSPESIQISTGNNFIQTSAENSDFSVFKKFTVAAGEIISLFAKTLGIKIFANRGKVEIQAQGDAMELTSLKDMKIQSKDGEVYIASDKKITLVCDKTALIIESSGVTIKTTGDVNVKSATLNRLGPQNYQYAPPELPDEATCVEAAK
ncbi:type VI secretion system Vgr family protein [Intestinirhabdus alba]|uniref:Type VI secretion system tip protein VgrG n=1 Tax=Intestinirhabdus alba TaxID=2899544 RepID=A0A6L6IKK4_9ENTR|nr:type VI secretion system Vgr family protein [Intestinirhabdus alba]MTH46484.1 type VI secretion system tip protein VgrG [Intestinirhabdus alba]